MGSFRGVAHRGCVVVESRIATNRARSLARSPGGKVDGNYEDVALGLHCGSHRGLLSGSQIPIGWSEGFRRGRNVKRPLNRAFHLLELE